MIYYQFAIITTSEMEVVILPNYLKFLYIFIRPIRIFKERLLKI